MSLVAYASSDESDDGVEGTIENEKVNLGKSELVKSVNAKEYIEDDTFSLPPPKQYSEDIVWGALSSKKTLSVRITVPKLPEKDEDYPKKYKKQSMTGSGLFALLPTPKNDKTLVPRKVMQQIVTSVKKPVVNKHKVIQKVQGKSNVEFSDSEDDSECNDVDFFSLTSKDNQEVTPKEIKLQEKYSVNFNPPKTESAELIKHFDVQQNQDPDSSLLDETKSNQELASSSIQLDEMALVHLCGSRAKRRKSHESMEIIDVDGAALIPDANDWLTKELTQEQNVRRNKRKGGPTSLQRRKHQITYLAFQAKENELELKNQWANNRMTRKQTQAKYGF